MGEQTMTIQEAMNKATEGGYHINGSDGIETDYGGANSEYSVWTRKDNESSFIVPVAETFLDPHFWHALGRGLEWEKEVMTVHTVENGGQRLSREQGNIGSTIGTASLITSQKGALLKPSLKHSSPLRQGKARSMKAKHGGSLRVAESEENPSRENHIEGKHFCTYRIVCTTLAGLNRMLIALMRGDGASETFLGVWTKPNSPATRLQRSCLPCTRNVPNRA